MPKRRKPFTLKDRHGAVIGHGVAYPEGNVQVYLKANGNAAYQIQLSDVLLLDGVASFHWRSQSITQSDNCIGNDVWNRIDGAYDPSEFEVCE